MRESSEKLPAFTLYLGMMIWKSTALLVISALVLGGCELFPTDDEPEDPVPPGQTRILRFQGTPNPIARGDTMLLTVRIRDSLDTSFEYQWFLEGVLPVIITDTNQVRWVADLKQGEYGHLVMVTNYDPDKIAPSAELVFKVLEK